MSLIEQSEEFKSLIQFNPNAQLPQQAYLFKPARDDDVFFVCEDVTKTQRMIYYGNQKWEKWEQKYLDEFRQFLDSNFIVLPKEITEQEIMRQLQANMWDHKGTLKSVVTTYEWQRDMFPLKMTPEVANLIKSGFLYVGGRDRNFRPLLIIKANVFSAHKPYPNLEQSIMAYVFAIEYINKYFHVPGQVENWNILVDMKDISLLNIPVKSMKGLAVTLQSQYQCVASKIFLVNISSTFNFIWKTVK